MGPKARIFETWEQNVGGSISYGIKKRFLPKKKKYFFCLSFYGAKSKSHNKHDFSKIDVLLSAVD